MFNTFNNILIILSECGLTNNTVCASCKSFANTFGVTILIGDAIKSAIYLYPKHDACSGV